MQKIKKPAVSYAGSFIQQNFGESLEHGFLLWDLEKRDYEFVEIENDFAFFTIDIDDTGFYEIPKQLENRKSPRIRIRHNSLPNDLLLKIINEIKKKFNPETVLVVTNGKFKIEKDFLKNNDNFLYNFQNVESQNFFIQKYAKHCNIQDYQFLIDLNIKYNQSLNYGVNDVRKNCSLWKIERLEFSNLFSYGENNVIDFENNSGLLGLFGNNATGKSAILNIIQYAIFDKCYKTNRVNQIINIEKDYFYVAITLKIENKRYLIEKKGKRQNNNTIKVNLNFYEIDLDTKEKICLNQSDKKQTEDLIKNYFGTFEEFIQLNILNQNSNNNFVNLSQSERKKFLIDILELNIFDELHTLVKNDIKNNQVLIREYSNIDPVKLEENKKLLLNLEDQYDKNKKLIFDINSKLQEVIDKINFYYKEYVEFEERVDKEILLYKSNKIEKEIKVLQDKLDEIQDTLQKKKLNLEKFILENSQIEKLLTNYDTSIFLKKSEIIEFLNDYEKQKLEYTKRESLYYTNLEKTKKLNELEYDSNCEYCMKNVFVLEAIEVKKNLKKQYELLLEYKNKLDEKENKKNLYLEQLKIQEEYENLILRKNKNYTQVLNVKYEIEKIEGEKVELNRLIENKKDERIKILDTIKKLEKNFEIEKKISELKIEQKDLNERIERLNTIQNNLLVQISNLRNVINTEEEKYQKYLKLISENKMLAQYAELVSKDGIPNYIISETLEFLSSRVNKILENLCDFKIKFEMNKNDIEIFLIYNDKKVWNLELASGMENFICAIVIRLALFQLSSKSKSTFFAIDEGWGQLDANNLSNVIYLFEYLKTVFDNVLIISHNAVVKDFVDSSHLLFKNENNESQIVLE